MRAILTRARAAGQRAGHAQLGLRDALGKRLAQFSGALGERLARLPARRARVRASE